MTCRQHHSRDGSRSFTRTASSADRGLTRPDPILPVLAAIPFILPGGEIDAGELRQDYVRRLSGFEGTKYHWGGEGSRGIDCSGLPRRALRDALLAYGFRHSNGPGFRGYVEQWWFDASAMALGEGYRDYMTQSERRERSRRWATRTWFQGTWQ